MLSAPGVVMTPAPFAALCAPFASPPGVSYLAFPCARRWRAPSRLREDAWSARRERQVTILCVRACACVREGKLTPTPSSLSLQHARTREAAHVRAQQQYSEDGRLPPAGSAPDPGSASFNCTRICIFLEDFGRAARRREAKWPNCNAAQKFIIYAAWCIRVTSKTPEGFQINKAPPKRNEANM